MDTELTIDYQLPARFSSHADFYILENTGEGLQTEEAKHQYLKKREK